MEGRCTPEVHKVQPCIAENREKLGLDLWLYRSAAADTHGHSRYFLPHTLFFAHHHDTIQQEGWKCSQKQQLHTTAASADWGVCKKGGL